MLRIRVEVLANSNAADLIGDLTDVCAKAQSSVSNVVSSFSVASFPEPEPIPGSSIVGPQLPTSIRAPRRAESS